MNTQIDVPEGAEPTGRYIVTFKEGSEADGMTALKKGAGLGKGKMMSSKDFGEAGIDLEQVGSGDAVHLEQLGIVILGSDGEVASALSQDAGENSPILAVEPEGTMYALGDGPGLTQEYLRGYRDAVSNLYASAGQGGVESDPEIAAAYADTATLTWGLQATRVPASRYSGRGIRVAVLDTGLDLRHPDFQGRVIVSRPFVNGAATAQDGHGHGTHCIGTACGPRQPGQGRRYGIAYGAQIYVGKVLSDQGSGVDAGILAGIDWAVANKCQVISMSLGADVPTTSVAYETAGQRALNAGSLIVAAASNNADRANGQFGFVGRPANSRSFMAVAALDSALKVANFSPRDTVRSAGTAVDIAGPGVNVYSSWPMPTRYRSISGTSMATPHVAGIAALWSECTGARGAALWQRLIVNARVLSAPVVDVGRGLVQAP